MDIYKQRRGRLAELMDEGAVAVFASGSEKTRSHDTEYPFRASSDVLYLTGFEEPDAVVVFAPGHKDGPLFMFVRPRDKDKEIWYGRRAGIEGAQEHFGADNAWNLDQLDKELPGLLEDATTLYHRFGQDQAFDGRLVGIVEGLRRRRGKPPAGPRTWKDTRDLLNPMRQIKSPAELELLGRACAISAEAHMAAMKACRPGMYEYELQALIEYLFLKNGAASVSYTTIVGGGDNATILHYIENQDHLQDGDLVLIDAGAEYQHYAGDITRTFPVSGTFTPPQRDLYLAVLQAEEAAIELCQTGRTWKEIHDATVRDLTQSMVDLKLLDGNVDDLIEQETYKRYFMHKTGHWLGMDVHDVGPYYDGQEPTHLRPGVVQTIEPGLYISAHDEEAPEHFRGIGVRIEDDVLTTEDGPVILTSGVPKDVETIEALIGSGYTLKV